MIWKASGIGHGFSTVVTSGGRIYTTGTIDDQISVFAFDMAGKPVWNVTHGPDYTQDHPGARATPVVDGDRLYLMSGIGKVGGYSVKDGSKIWTRDMTELGGEIPGWGYTETPLVHNNLLIVTPGGRTPIVALNKSTGATIWKSSGFSAGAQYSSAISATYQGVPMIINGTDRGIVAVSPTDGSLLWRNDFSAGNTANVPTPAYSDGYVFWANGYGRGGICLKLSEVGGKVTAAEAWRTSRMDCHVGGFIVRNGYIYGNHGGGWNCLDLKTGELKWSHRGVGKGEICYADGMLYLYSERGGIAGLGPASPEGFELAGQFSVEGRGESWAYPVVIGGRLYLRYDENLYCFDVKA
jgi:outer membrane protein assembly factor BamB